MKKRGPAYRLLTTAQKPAHNPDIGALVQAQKYLITPIDHDYAGLTAAMWNGVFQKLGISASMAMMVGDPVQVGDIVQNFRHDPKYVGGGSGSGFKEAVIPYLDDITPLAKAMGSVNIIKKAAHGRLVGHNTDGIGYALSLEQLLGEQGQKLKGTSVLMLGAGGTGRAIAFALAQQGAELTILNRTEEKARQLAKAVNAYTDRISAVGGGRRLISKILPLQDAVISVIDDAHSPLDEYSTLGDMPVPVTPDSIQKNREQTDKLLRRARPSLIISDIRLRQKETAMLAQARAHGLPVLDGIPMVLNQGVEAFWWIFGEEIQKKGGTRGDVETIMRSALSQKT